MSKQYNRKSMVCAGKIEKGNKCFYVNKFDIGLKTEPKKDKILIKNENGTYEVSLEELYIKPFYAGDKPTKYSICTNERNQEIVLGEYDSKSIAEHAMHLLKLFKSFYNPIDMPTGILVCSDLYANALYKLEAAKKNYLENGK